MTYNAFRLKRQSIKFIDTGAFFFIKLNYILKNAVLQFFSNILYKDYNPAGISKILILRMGSMGDTITALPAFTAIRKNFPNAKIDLLSNKFQPGKAFISEILPRNFFFGYYYYEKFVDKGIVKQLRHNKYDLYIELPTYRASLYFEIRSLMVAKRIGARYGIGWHVSSDHFMRQSQQELLTFDSNRVRLLEILKLYGLKVDNTFWLLEENSVILPLVDTDKILQTSKSGEWGMESEERRAESGEWEMESGERRAESEGRDGMERGKKGLIALAPGAGSDNKKWPLPNFIEVANHFSENNYLVILIGGNQDVPECESISKGNVHIINLCGKLTVLENASVLKKSNLAISNDSGLMHLAYSVGTPVIGLFSAQDYEGKWEPPHEAKNTVIRSETLDMANISVEKVMNAAYQTLDPGKGKGEV